MGSELNYIGLKNYLKIFTADKIFIKAFMNNIYWVILGTLGPIGIALPLSAILATKIKGMNFFRNVFFMPYILPPMVVALIWGWIYNPVFGLLNTFLEFVGLDFLAQSWLGNPNTALTALIITAIWSYFGFCVVILIAGLQNINVSLYEAAEIDGASSIQKFFKITIPQLKGVLTMLVSYTFIGGFARVFDIVWVTTKGGPGNATEVLVSYIYRKAFQQNNVGYGSAMSLTLSFIVVITTFIFIKYQERNEID